MNHDVALKYAFGENPQIRHRFNLIQTNLLFQQRYSDRPTSGNGIENLCVQVQVAAAVKYSRWFKELRSLSLLTDPCGEVDGFELKKKLGRRLNAEALLTMPAVNNDACDMLLSVYLPVCNVQTARGQYAA